MDINPIIPILVTILVPLLTQGVKKIQAIPISEGQTAKVRTFVGISTFVLTATGAYLAGDLQSVLSPEILQVGLVSVINFLVILVGHKGVKTISGN